MEHEYTATNLSLDGLKGNDAKVVEYLSTVANAEGDDLFEVRFALLKKHRVGSGDDDGGGYYGGRYGGYGRGGGGNATMNEDYGYDDSIDVETWMDLDGNKIKDNMQIDLGTISSFSSTLDHP